MKGLRYKDFASKIRMTQEGVSETSVIIDSLSADDAQKVSALQWDASLADLAQTLIGSIQVTEGTKITTSVFAEVDLEEYDMNPNSKFGEFAEEGSEVGFEALSRMTFDDHDNKYSLRFQNFKYIGVAHQKNVGGYTSLTYIILADSKLYDKATNQDKKSVGLNKQQKTSLQRWYQGVPKPDTMNQRTDKSSTLNTVFGDKNNNDSTAPILNQYDNTFFNEIIPNKKKEDNIVNMKSYKDREDTVRTIPAVESDLPSVENRVSGWQKHNLDKREILEKADLKPPSYFNVNKLQL